VRETGRALVVPRSLGTPFVAEWNSRLAEVEREAERLRAEVTAAIHEGRAAELLPLTGQTAGMVGEVLPAAEIVNGLVAQAEAALRSAIGLLTG